MAEVGVELWIRDQEDVVTYTVDVEGGIKNTDEAVQLAREKAIADGYEEVDVKQLQRV